MTVWGSVGQRKGTGVHFPAGDLKKTTPNPIDPQLRALSRKEVWFQSAK